ncbi:thioredoxin-related protein [Aquimarina sp. EL_43]|uniref:hypothetical protein n=1 Tax=unclassified Aquimarina TaxID=2627091 RepID=UPI0018C96065|nr:MULTISPECIES: hypothetical protein [unclassified Aquimarina]MBG6130337.1 thioredoxin-related protein [Aquimarina sp. EL_35]MBG6149117.1 thioredoxin-related protein [Aquimarina sp. EL_32]MBG6168509.1 thioredoxin-related protein [Aquimarina sp. EL_43]
MKLKLLTFLLAISTILLGGLAYWYYLEANFSAKVIKDRELTITNYKKVVNAIGRSGGVHVNKLKTELKKEFDLNEKIGYSDHSKEYYYVLYPKKYEVNSREIWDFRGLELTLDEQKAFKTIHMYKP